MKNVKLLKGKSYLGCMMFLCMVTVGLRAQYNQDLPPKDNLAVGIRIGGTSGVTAKYFYKNNMAAEGIIGTFGNGFSLTGLLERQLPVYNAQGLYLYYGGGAHLAFYNGEDKYANHFGREVDYRKNNDV